MKFLLNNLKQLFELPIKYFAIKRHIHDSLYIYNNQSQTLTQRPSLEQSQQTDSSKCLLLRPLPIGGLKI